MQEDFEDEVKPPEKDSLTEKSTKKTTEELTLSKSETSKSATSVDDSTILDLLDLSTNEPTETDCLLDIFNSAANGCKPSASTQQSNILTFDFLKKIPGSTASLSLSSSSSSSSAAVAATTEASSGKKGVIAKAKINDKKTSAWMDLFADLDPLANPTTMEKKIAGLNQNCLDA